MLEAIELPTDHVTDISQLIGRVVIFRDGEVFNGGISILSYEPNNQLLENFPDSEFDKILID